MTPLHRHVCPRCLSTWRHEDTSCRYEDSHICDLCAFNIDGSISTLTQEESRLMFHLDIHSRWELQVFLDDNDSDFLSKWIAEDDISNAVKQLMSEEEELESIQSNLESNRAIDATEDPNNLELHSSIQRMQEELLNPDLPKFKKDFLKRELRVWELELAYRQRQPEGFSKPRKSRESNGGTRVTFEVESAEF